MKPLKTALMLLLLSITTASFAQKETKVSLFSKEPSKMSCSSAVLSDAFGKTEGQQVKISFADRIYSGTVISNLVKYHNLQSMSIRLNGFDNAVLHLSKQVLDDKSINFVGRIMNNNANDGYVIERTGNHYTFVKINTNKILEECH